MTDSTNQVNQTGPTVRQTIVASLEAPRLTGVATKHFAAFTEKRDLYEKHVAEKTREPGVTITPSSYSASIDDAHLRIFITAEWIKASGIKSITEQQLIECVKSKATIKADGDDLARIEGAVRKVKMDLNIKEAEDLIWSLHLHYTDVLESAGIVDLPQQKPHIAIKHILKHVNPTTLRHRMEDIILWRRDEDFGTKDFGAFMRELPKQAKQLDKEQESRSRRSFGTDADESEDSDDDENDKGKRAKKGKSKHMKGFERK